MTRRAFLAGLMMLAAQLALADTTTTNFKFIIPTTGSFNWAAKVDDWMVKIDTGVAGLALRNIFSAYNQFQGISATSGTFTMTGVQYSITTSSGISVGNGMVVAPGGLVGPLFGDITSSTGTLPVAHGGTGSTTASGARSNLSAAQSGANPDITSMTGGGAAVSFPNGVSGTSATWSNGVTASSGTFTATGAGQYSAHLSSGALIDNGDIKAPNSCVILKNGTYCGNAAGGGDMTQAGINNMTGAINWVAGSSAAFVPAAYVSDIPHRISSGTITGLSTFTYQIPRSTQTYELKLEGCVQNTSNGSTNLTFNGDTTSTHYAAAGICANGGGSNAFGQTATLFAANVIWQDSTVLAGKYFEVVFRFSSVTGTNVVWGRSNGSYWRADGYYMGCSGAMYYTGSSPISSVKITASAGTFTCTSAELWEER